MFLQLVGAAAIGAYLYSLQKLDKPPISIVTTLSPWAPGLVKNASEQPQHRIVDRVITVDPSTGLPVEIRTYESGFKVMVGLGVASTGPDARDFTGPPPQ